ncbi:HAD family hydrolase [Pseudonocardia broussonetiae]|uniref:Cation-translocating P-type ATPase n=1 Tax=Pseudonocardia broussonetiae TaxID=2736640 RepID=A0A6M6JLE1_9PSEU|nr:HAD family hydrolase [Pseudonocardia broussonetiae]QJY47870.1 cation-translocating P-type ATPase [Pseudonocardia broussonetiae]
MLTVPVVVLTWVPPLQFPVWQWVGLLLTVPIVTWGALPLYLSALAEVRRGSAALGVLVALTVSAAFGMSVHSLLAGPAGTSGFRQAIPLTVVWGDGSGQLYLEVAAVVTTAALGARQLAGGPGPAAPRTWFVPTVLFAAVGGAFFWFGAGAGRTAALEIALAVLVASCPVALALDRPAAELAASDALRRFGITLRGVPALTVASRVGAALIAGSATLGPDGARAGAGTRPLGPTAVARLRGLDLDPVLFTGGADDVARAHADLAGVETVVAGLRPAETAAAVRRLQEAGAVVAVISGDPDEAPALAAADLGITLSSAVDVADVVIADTDPIAVVELLRLGRCLPATARAARRSAAATVTLAVPLAAAGLLHPAVAVGAVLIGAAGVAAISHRLRGPSPEWTHPHRADHGESP